MQLILASRSRYKADSLNRLGLSFTCVDPDIDETPHAGESPEELVLRLSGEKAVKVAGLHPQALVIAADQVAEMDGRILTKPGTAPRAVEQLKLLSGRTHRLLTGLAVCQNGVLHRHLEVNHLSMRPLSEDALRRYVERDQPLDCAGAYKIEQAGISLFSSVAGADPWAIVGLPLMALVQLLPRCGVEIP